MRRSRSSPAADRGSPPVPAPRPAQRRHPRRARAIRHRRRPVRGGSEATTPPVCRRWTPRTRAPTNRRTGIAPRLVFRAGARPTTEPSRPFGTPISRRTVALVPHLGMTNTTGVAFGETGVRQAAPSLPRLRGVRASPPAVSSTGNPHVYRFAGPCVNPEVSTKRTECVAGYVLRSEDRPRGILGAVSVILRGWARQEAVRSADRARGSRLALGRGSAARGSGHSESVTAGGPAGRRTLKVVPRRGADDTSIDPP